MDVRSYWISKLPAVRKQSPATGQLVEKLLINDSSVARSALVEMAKLSRGIRVQEEQTPEKIGNAIKFVSRKINDDISSGKEPSQNLVGAAIELDKIADKIKAPKIKSGISTHETELSQKVLQKIKHLYNVSGLKSEWEKFDIKTAIKTGVVVTLLALVLYFSVLMYKKDKSIGKSILIFVTGTVATILVVAAAKPVYNLLKDLWNLVSNLISSIFKKKGPEKAPTKTA